MNVKLGTFNEETIAERDVASFRVTDLTQNFELKIEHALVGDIYTSKHELPPSDEITSKFPHLKGLRFIELEDKSVNVILGAKFAHSYLTGEVRVGKENEPFAILTAFGPALVGPLDPDNELETSLCAINSETASLSDQIRSLFRHDFIMRENEIFPPEVTHDSAMDKLSRSQLTNSLVMNPETKHYQVALPWRLGRAETAKLFSGIDFYSNALSRLNKLKAKFLKNPELMKGSFAQMRESISLGHARILDTLEADPGSPVCYIPNHIVTHPDKPGKFRVCQDAASRVNGHCLNQYLLGGPDTLNSIVGVLCRCRRRRYFLTADVKSFFYQIEVNPLDTPALRFLWWTDETMTQVIVIEGTVNLFGLRSSPAVSNFCLRHHAELVKHEYPPNVYDAILNSMYVDDLLDCVDTPSEGKELKNNLVEAFDKGGFPLVKWKSNCPEIVADDETAHSPPSIPQEAVGDAGGRAFPAAIPSTESCAEQPTGRESSLKSRNDQEELPSPSRDVDDDDKDDTWPSEDPSTVSELVDRAFRSESDLKSDVTNLTESSPTSKVLGVGYDFESDCFFVKIGDKHLRNVVTKTDVLSWISSVFDPVGFVCPYVLKGRMFFQRINELDINWKDRVPDDILVPFNRWKDSVIHLKLLRIPRWTSALGLEDSVAELVCFCDASSEAYGVVCYIRRSLQGGGNDAHVAFLLAKSHVVPIAMQKRPTRHQEDHLDSIPRLELVAALTNAICRDMLLREAGEEFTKVWMFSDSVTILKWISDFDRRHKTFENFRINRIRSLTHVSEWRHVPSQSNPADISSKGIESDDQHKFKFFHSGPPFLRRPESEWPPRMPLKPTEKSNPDNTSVEGERIAAVMYSVVPSFDEDPFESEKEEILISPYHLLISATAVEEATTEEVTPWPLLVAAKKRSWLDKIRSIALIRKCILQLKARVELKKNPPPPTTKRQRKVATSSIGDKVRIGLSREEKEKAELLLISAIQHRHFSSDIKTLFKLNVFSPNALKELRTKSSQIRNLSPFLDENNLIRAASRFEKAEYLPYDTKFPIIIPGSNDEDVRALIRHVHVSNMHCSRVQTYYILKNRFFLLGGKTAVRSILGNCIICQRRDKNPSTQRLGNLPGDRVLMAAPFATSGLDCFGPYLTKYGRKQGKRWVLLATCFVTRAVCLIPLKDLSSTTVINALVRFNCQFPSVKKIYSDNETNFRSADRELREAVTEWKKKAVSDELEVNNIEWIFGPARCGSAGGVWERVIGLTKKLMKSVIGDKILDLDTFETVIAGAMAIMNRRPLTPASADIDDCMVLSPAHFLYPHQFTNSSLSVLPPSADAAETLRASWKRSRSVIDQFWHVWQKSYLAELQKKSRWHNSSNGPKVDQIVLMKDDNAPRERWRLARVVEIMNSDPTHVRRVRLKDASGTMFDRHVTGIVPLELDL